MKKIKILALMIFLINFAFAIGQNYYLNVYDDDEVEGWGVFIKSIDLNNTAVLNSVKLCDHGVIWRKNPLKVGIADRNYLITFTENGGYNKNSQIGIDHYTINYYIFEEANDNLSLIFADSLPGATIENLRQYPSENGFRMAIKSDDNLRDIYPSGIYTLARNFNFSFNGNIPSPEEPGALEDIDGIEHLYRFSWPNERNLFTTYPFSYTLVRLNQENSDILDSLSLPKNEGQMIKFTYHHARDRIYVFNLNYEVHGKFIDQSRESDAPPSQAYIYNPEDFTLVDTFPIDDYPDNEYPGPESGEADVVGDFIVYYFFEDDWIHKYNPAMLFIFDTRTNEASWLRVGWR